jgi:hypothetical protein
MADHIEREIASMTGIVRAIHPASISARAFFSSQKQAEKLMRSGHQRY